MTRIRINTHPEYDYSNVIVLDYCQVLRNLVADNPDKYLWAGGQPRQIMVSSKDGLDRWGNLERLVQACVESGCEVKARRERTDEWVVVESVDDLRPLEAAAVKEDKLNSSVSVTGKAGEGKSAMEKHAMLHDHLMSGSDLVVLDYTSEYEHILEEDQDEQAGQAEQEGRVDG